MDKPMRQIILPSDTVTAAHVADLISLMAAAAIFGNQSHRFFRFETVRSETCARRQAVNQFIGKMAIDSLQAWVNRRTLEELLPVGRHVLGSDVIGERHQEKAVGLCSEFGE